MTTLVYVRPKSKMKKAEPALRFLIPLVKPKRSMDVISRDRNVGRIAPLIRKQAVVGASLDIVESGRFAIHGNVGLAVAVVIVLDRRVGFGYAECRGEQAAVPAFQYGPR